MPRRTLGGDEEEVAVHLEVDLLRASDGRLEGTVITETGRAQTFSGTLDLLRILEDLQPARPTDEGRPR